MQRIPPAIPRRLSIAMATYNGAVHLQEQLDSILGQSSLPFELHVGDDGSTDSTHKIVKRFKEKAPFPVYLTVNSSRLGFSDNFLSTAARCTGDWIVFCDQDDVWLNSRLSHLSKAILSRAETDTLLVVQTAEVVDANLVSLGTRVPQPSADRLISRQGHPCFWVTPGMVQAVHSRLIHDFDWMSRPRDYITPTWPKQAHDKWTCMMANALGSTLYLEEPVVFYRRHELSVTGYQPSRRPFRRLHSFLTEGRKDYQFLEAVARDVTAYLEQLASRANPEDRTHLLESADEFRRFARVLSNRRTVWEEKTLRPRAGAVIANIRLGAYARRKGYRVGPVSLIKDLMRLTY